MYGRPEGSGHREREEIMNSISQLLAMLLALSMMFSGLAVNAVTGEAKPPVQEETGRAAAETGVQPAEETEKTEKAEKTEKIGLPAVGETIYGFTVQEIREFPLLGAMVVHFVHDRTGAGFVYIANDDTNRVFDLTFLTDTVDNTGLPHVFEHATTDGSRKYPSKSLFFNLSYQTYNTYMNASTYDRMTTYPVASLSEEQLLRYADYYTDSCLYPMIMEDESIFREEAWRYRLENADADLTIEGTVYSEMLGATTLERMAARNAMRTAFPGSIIGNDRGGLPEEIPNMTWEMLRGYHDKYYHPSNMVAFLYGDFQDYTAFLALLDEAVSPFERREFTREDPDYQPITGTVTAEFSFPVEAGSDTNNTSAVYYQILCPGAEGDEQMTLNTLTDLMAASASPMAQAVARALPSATFSSYIDISGPVPAVTFYALNVNREDGPVFRQVIDEQLALIAEKGFEQDYVDSVMASVSMEILQIRETPNVGISILPSIAYNYSNSGNLFEYMDYVDALQQMGDWNKAGKYRAAAARWLAGAETTSLTTTYPAPGLKEEQAAAEKERLARIKAAMSEEEIAALVAQSNAPEQTEDASAYVKQLQAVTVSTLPEEIRIYDVSDATDEKNIRHVNATAHVDGVGQVDLFLDAAALPQEDLHWFKLLTGLTDYLDTEKYTKEEAAVLSTRYLYDKSVRFSLLLENGAGYHPYLGMRWISRDEDLEKSYEVMYDLVFGLKFDAEKVQEGVKAIRSSLRASIQSSPYSVQLYRSLGIKNELYRLYSYTNFVEYYEFLTQVEEALASQPEAVCAKLQGVLDFLKNSSGAIAAYSGSEAGQAVNAPLADAFMDHFPNEARERAVYDLPVPAASEALAIESSVQYNAIIADFDTLGLDEFNGGMDAVTNLVLDKFLYPMLRDQYGAYAVLHGALEDGGMYIITYRDPNVMQTFQVFAQLPALVSSLETDQQTLDGYILSSYPTYAASQGELTGAAEAVMLTLEGESQEKPLRYMRELKQVTPESLKQWGAVYQTLMEKGFVSTSGPMSVINQNAPLYQQVLNPFGAKDTSTIVFSDLPEDSPFYAAVRSAFESGLMAPKGEETFGVEENATVGELAAALYVLMGGTRNEEEAVAVFAQYGLIAAEDKDAVLTRGRAGDIMLPLLGVTAEGLDGSGFADYDASQNNLLWLVSNGLISSNAGENGLLLDSQTPVTRGELAQTLTNLLTLMK